MLGIEYFNSWQEAICIALAVMFLFTGATHFSAMKQDYARMIPKPFPRSLWLIYLTGVLEIAGAIGLLLPPIRAVTGICLIILLLALFPANFNAARSKIPFRAKPPTTLWLRAFVQLFFVWALWWASV